MGVERDGVSVQSDIESEEVALYSYCEDGIVMRRPPPRNHA